MAKSEKTTPWSPTSSSSAETAAVAAESLQTPQEGDPISKGGKFSPPKRGTTPYPRKILVDRENFPGQNKTKRGGQEPPFFFGQKPKKLTILVKVQ